jgi:small-conductance mechanosensitive channel
MKTDVRAENQKGPFSIVFGVIKTISNIPTKQNFIKIIVYTLLLFILRVSGFFIEIPLNIWATLSKFLSSIIIFMLGREIIYVISSVLPTFVKSKRTEIVANQVLMLLWALVIVASLFTLLSIEQTLSSIIIGLIGFGLTFSLQQPIMSFIGWMYIVIRKPFSIGDRIKVGDNIKGDVVSFDYFSTHLLEFGGDYTSTETPSGRMIRFPNSLILQQPIFNYSVLGSHVWDELTFTVTYKTDLKFVTEKIEELLKDYFNTEELETPIKKIVKIISKSFIENLNVNYRPNVIFMPNKFGLIEVKVSYLTDIKKMTSTKNEITKILLSGLSKYPETVEFPEVKDKTVN